MGNLCSSKSEKSWPQCCQIEHNNKTHFNFKDSPDQQKAQQWIQRSLLPSYKPCRSCATGIKRRYNDHHRKTIDTKINWLKYETSEIREMFGLPQSANNNISIKHLSVKNLVQLGLTCGASDFVDVIMKSMINGKKLSHYICSNIKPYNASDILAKDIQNIMVLLVNLRVSEIDNMVNIVQKVLSKERSHKFINIELEFGSKPYGERIKKSGAIFGHIGAKFGIKGKDCGGKASECARIGKEKGGRPVGSKNCISLTIEERLSLCELFEDSPRDTWNWIIKSQFAYLCLDREKGTYNESIVKNIRADVENWMDPAKLDIYKKAKVHKRGKLKWLGVGRCPAIAELEEKVDELLLCLLNDYKYIGLSIILNVFTKIIKETDEYMIDANTNGVKKRGENGVFGIEILVRIDEPYIRRFMGRYHWTSVDSKMNTELNVPVELERYGPHWIMINALFVCVGQDITKDLHNSDPQLMAKYYVYEKQIVKKGNRRSKGPSKRSGAMEGVGTNFTIRSNGWSGENIYVSKYLNWYKAMDYCMQYDLTLVTITNDNDIHTATNIIGENPIEQSPIAWIGLEDINNDAKWICKLTNGLCTDYWSQSLMYVFCAYHSISQFEYGFHANTCNDLQPFLCNTPNNNSNNNIACNYLNIKGHTFPTNKCLGYKYDNQQMSYKYERDIYNNNNQINLNYYFYSANCNNNPSLTLNVSNITNFDCSNLNNELCENNNIMRIHQIMNVYKMKNIIILNKELSIANSIKTVIDPYSSQFQSHTSEAATYFENSNGVVITCDPNNVECCPFNTSSPVTSAIATYSTDSLSTIQNNGNDSEYTLILKQGDVCIDGYKDASNDAYCEPCGVNEAGRFGSCDECGNGKHANDDHTECVLCDDNFIGVNGYCDIDCAQTNKITNELHTECINTEKEYWYATAEFDAVVSGIGVLTGFSCIGAHQIHYKYI